MAFPNQPESLVLSDFYTLSAISGNFAQAFRRWRSIRSNREYLRGVLPGVVEGNPTPLHTYRGDKRLSDLSVMREGYVMTASRDAVPVGTATIIEGKCIEEGEGLGLQLDFRISPVADKREELAARVGKALISRSLKITEDMQYLLVPFALLSRNVEDDPSGSFATTGQMMRIGEYRPYQHSVNYNGTNEPLDVYRVFSPHTGL